MRFAPQPFCDVWIFGDENSVQTAELGCELFNSSLVRPEKIRGYTQYLIWVPSLEPPDQGSKILMKKRFSPGNAKLGESDPVVNQHIQPWEK